MLVVSSSKLKSEPKTNAVDVIQHFVIFILQKDCKDVLCPRGKIPLKNACVTNLSRRVGCYISLDILLEIYPHLPDDSYMYICTHLKEYLSTALRKSIGVCDFYIAQIQKDDTLNQLYLYIKIGTNVKCPFRKVIDMFTEINTCSLNASNTITLTLMMNDFPTSTRTVTTCRYKTTPCLISERLDSSLINYHTCPAVRLPSYQLQQMGLTSTSINVLSVALFNDQSARESDSINVCIDTYLQIAERFVNSATSLVVCVPAVIMVMVVSLE